VAIVVMPDAPTATVNALGTAVADSGGVLNHTVKVNQDVFDPTRATAVTKALGRYDPQLEVTESMSGGTRFGLALGRALLGKQPAERDVLATEVTEAMTSAGLISVDGRSTEQAELALVVTSEAAEPRPSPDLLNDHVAMQVALKQHAVGVVLAGPNSADIEGTDVLTARSDSAAGETLSTVDVADLSSGVVTTVLAGREQLLGRQGHYGALARSDSPLPQLPVR
jgi:hypothetical protein